MNYHNITTDDMKNGDGLRVVLWLSGCSHKCKGCHNPQTWDCNSGIVFDENAKKEIYEQLDNDYISGLTLSGGDPLFISNRKEVRDLVIDVSKKYPNKTIWLYTGYTLKELQDMKDEHVKDILNSISVIVDGKYEEDNSDINYPWAGSTNQKVIRMEMVI